MKVEEIVRFKFVDDLTFLEVIYLLSVGIATYNVKQHVPSNIPSHNQIIPPRNLKSQQSLNVINEWTKKKKMKLNVKKTKNMIFNFTRKYQFTTSLSVDDQPLEIVKETKLLGTYITEDLRWNKNTAEIVKKAWQRMQLLNRASRFTSNKWDLKQIYLIYIRSILEQSGVVWHSSLSQKNKRDLERVQKVAVKVILGKNYTSYKAGLELLKMENLDKRRERLCLSFAKKSIQNEKASKLFPKNQSTHNMKKRRTKKFKPRITKTTRYQKSAIPYLINMLNKDEEIRKKQMK